eukprot:TRINITY_DN1788_c1_g1_i4.p1 TRINITY_DN1788_c1_g1~~TRINITY_DN1788_c1_g1_i4.p1  ORF type:complete len:199 (+),score=-12.86 TRINITY_DN1788_c1_g1_i4:522-1118(+)
MTTKCVFLPSKNDQKTFPHIKNNDKNLINRKTYFKKQSGNTIILQLETKFRKKFYSNLKKLQIIILLLSFLKQTKIKLINFQIFNSSRLFSHQTHPPSPFYYQKLIYNQIVAIIFQKSKYLKIQNAQTIIKKVCTINYRINYKKILNTLFKKSSNQQSKIYFKKTTYFSIKKFFTTQPTTSFLEVLRLNLIFYPIFRV